MFFKLFSTVMYFCRKNAVRIQRFANHQRIWESPEPRTIINIFFLCVFTNRTGASWRLHMITSVKKVCFLCKSWKKHVHVLLTTSVWKHIIVFCLCFPLASQNEGLTHQPNYLFNESQSLWTNDKDALNAVIIDARVKMASTSALYAHMLRVCRHKTYFNKNVIYQ